MKPIFCTKCNQETAHKGYVDNNGEFVFSCQTKDCGVFVKFPQVESKAELLALIEDRKVVNEAVAEAAHAFKNQEAILSQVLDDGTEVTVTSEDTE